MNKWISGLGPIIIDSSTSSLKLQKVFMLFPAFLCIFNLLLPRFYIIETVFSKKFGEECKKKSRRSKVKV